MDFPRWMHKRGADSIIVHSTGAADAAAADGFRHEYRADDDPRPYTDEAAPIVAPAAESPAPTKARKPKKGDA